MRTAVVLRVWQVAGIVAVLLMLSAQVMAASPVVGDEETVYDVTYRLNQFEAQTAKGVRIVDVTTIGSKEFLVLQHQAFAQKVHGYIELTSVLSILPSGVVVEPASSGRAASSLPVITVPSQP